MKGKTGLLMLALWILPGMVSAGELADLLRALTGGQQQEPTYSGEYLESVSGRVLEEGSGRPLAGAVVVMWHSFGRPYHENRPCYIPEVSWTDDEGRYHFSLIKPDDLPEARREKVGAEERLLISAFRDGYQMPVTDKGWPTWEGLDIDVGTLPLRTPEDNHLLIDVRLQPLAMQDEAYGDYLFNTLYQYMGCHQRNHMLPAVREQLFSALLHAHTEQAVRRAYDIGTLFLMLSYPERKLKFTDWGPLSMRMVLVEQTLAGNGEMVFNYGKVRSSLKYFKPEREQELTELIRDGRRFSLEVTDGRGANLMRLAVSAASAPVVQALLERGYRLDPKGESSYINWAVQKEDIDTLRLLLDHGLVLADVREPVHLMRMAIMRSRRDMLKLLVEKGPGFRELLQKSLLDKPDFRDMEKTDGPMFELLLDYGMSPNVYGRSGEHILAHAIAAGRRDGVEVLLSHGASVRSPARRGAKGINNSVMAAAIRSGDAALVEAILAHRPQLSESHEELIVAAASGNQRIYRSLLDYGLQETDAVAPGLLQYALVRGELDRARELLKRFNMPDHFEVRNGSDYPHDYNEYFLDTALRKGYMELARTFVERGFSMAPKHQDILRNRHRSGTRLAAAGQFEMLDFLVSKGVIGPEYGDVERTRLIYYVVDNGRTEHDLRAAQYRLEREQGEREVEQWKKANPGRKPACFDHPVLCGWVPKVNMPPLQSEPDSGEQRRLRKAIIGRLLDAGFDIDRGDYRYGYTLLMRAAAVGDEDMLRFLLQRGADPGVRAGDGRSAADIARAGHHEGLAALLEKVSGVR